VTSHGARRGGDGLRAALRRLRGWNARRRARARRLAVKLREERRRGQDEIERHGGSARHGDNLP
jgi:hypothetical protein